VWVAGGAIAIAEALTVGAAVPMSGRYAVQGAQVLAGLELWAQWAGARLLLEDDASRPDLAVVRYGELLDRCELVLGPYGSDSVRAVARAGFPAPLWNHGGAADDVQGLYGAVSVPSPASRYLIAVGRAVALERPGCSVALVTAAGVFARLAREGLEREAAGVGITLAGAFSLTDSPSLIAASKPDVVLLCGPPEQEIALLRSLRRRLPAALLGGVSPGIGAFPDLFGADPDGLFAPSQWHPALPGLADLGPTTLGVLAAARARGPEPLDYVATQAFACGLVALRCRESSPDDPLSAARALRTTTFFGGFALDPETGLQRGHRLCVVRWRGTRQELVLADAA
jgi:ABC-type branched-subunit amino acid transport system substrate-binding protein